MLKLPFFKSVFIKRPSLKSISASATAQVEAIASKSAAKSASSTALKQLVRSPSGKFAIGLSLLGASTGFAFTQIVPTRLQSTVSLPSSSQAPLRRAGDPSAESILSAQHLFLTNQILSSKIQALAKVPPASVNSTGTATGAPTKTPTDKGSAPSTGGSSPATQNSTPNPGAANLASAVAATAPAPKVSQPVFTGTTIDTVLEMRVAVAKDVNAIAFATSSGGVIANLDGSVLKSLPAETASLAEISNGIVVDGQALPTAFWIYPENGGFVAIGDSWYRGRVLVALRDRGLIAVNYVLLGDYLYSVVGSEMSPNWPLESLKAQAVAARSYALTHNIHPASETYFDLDNTPRFQAYKGISREANTTQAAVQATAGEFISHQGGIVESLYAASQAIVDDAHSGSGMSQLGARDLAGQGHSYADILGYYYPGTALGRLETDSE